MENKKFTVYSISTNGKVFYIGRTCDLRRRKNEHLRESHKKFNSYKVNKIRKLKKLGESIEFNILHENLSYEDSVNLEIEEIRLHKENDCELTNLTEGGEGLYGATREFTDEWKDNLKKAKKIQYDNGYIPNNKGKTLVEIVGSEQKAKEIIERTNKTRKERGIIPINVGKKLEEFVSPERAIELRKISSETAKKTFTGTKQSEEHKRRKTESLKNTISNRTDEQKRLIRERNKINGAKSIKFHKFIIDNKYTFYGTWKSLSQDLKNNLGIITGPGSLISFYKGKYKTMTCGIVSIVIID